MNKINNDWEYIDQWSDAFIIDGSADKIVRLPHTVQELPLHYANSESYQKVVGYRKKLTFDSSLKDRRYFIRFDGSAHETTVYFNGKELYVHSCGYTAFIVELTDNILFDQENVLTVKVDSREGLNTPPFGFVIDYLTYGGIYRDVWLYDKPAYFIKDVFVTTNTLDTVSVSIQTDGVIPVDSYQVKILDSKGEIIAQQAVSINKYQVQIPVKNIHAWTAESPTLYRCIVELGDDIFATNFGFRTIRFDQNNLYINDQKVFLRGLNRHQCYPYIGYAAVDSLQEEDVRILKEELHVNAVRTSHYPQSQSFIDACDRYGLYVFTEIPGWQHIGDQTWKQQAIRNTEDMVLQYRNHPSIILWGVRINESLDDDKLYSKTNEVARNLDSTRPTAGVRYLTKSHLLEDIYTFNDFSHHGDNKGALSKTEVMVDTHHPLIISEANGHMFPTKSFDTQARRQEHALRHARVFSDAIADHQHTGVFQWCMFDYSTHKDFGSGNRICYHGVMDSFRNPKLAASVYASQQDEEPILEISTSMDIGDYNAGNLPDFYAFTNADEVRLYKNDQFVSTFSHSAYSGLKHGPIRIDDTIGKLLETNEHFSKDKAADIRKCLLASKKYGSNLPLRYRLLYAKIMFQYKMSYSDGVALFGKYVSGWGSDSITWRFDAIKNGKVIKSIIKRPSTKLHLSYQVSRTSLVEGSCYDMSAIRIQVKDEYHNLASYAQLPLNLITTGPIEIVGPNTVVTEGGMTGTYIKTTGEEGEAFLTISTPDCSAITIHFTISKEA